MGKKPGYQGIADIHFTVINSATGKLFSEAVITTDESLKTYAINERGVAFVLMKACVHSVTVLCANVDAYTGIVKADVGVNTA